MSDLLVAVLEWMTQHPAALVLILAMTVGLFKHVIAPIIVAFAAEVFERYFDTLG